MGDRTDFPESLENALEALYQASPSRKIEKKAMMQYVDEIFTLKKIQGWFNKRRQRDNEYQCREGKKRMGTSEIRKEQPVDPNALEKYRALVITKSTISPEHQMELFHFLSYTPNPNTIELACFGDSRGMNAPKLQAFIRNWREKQNPKKGKAKNQKAKWVKDEDTEEEDEDGEDGEDGESEENEVDVPGVVQNIEPDNVPQGGNVGSERPEEEEPPTVIGNQEMDDFNFDYTARDAVDQSQGNERDQDREGHPEQIVKQREADVESNLLLENDMSPMNNGSSKEYDFEYDSSGVATLPQSESPAHELEEVVDDNKDKAPQFRGNDAQEDHEKFLMKNIIAGMELRRDADVETIRKLHKQLEESDKKNASCEKPGHVGDIARNTPFRDDSTMSMHPFSAPAQDFSAAQQQWNAAAAQTTIAPHNPYQVGGRQQNTTFAQKQVAAPYAAGGTVHAQPQRVAYQQAQVVQQPQASPAAGTSAVDPVTEEQESFDQWAKRFSAIGALQFDRWMKHFRAIHALDEGGTVEAQMKRKHAEASISAVDPVTGKPDFSAQWIEFYKAVGACALDEAKAVEAQMKRKHAEASISAVDPVTGKPDFSAQWIEFYKAVGACALDEAKAVEAQMKRKHAEASISAVDPVTGKPDFSAQWIEFYKAVGACAFDEAKAVEAQMKRKHAEASISAVDPVTGKPDFSAQWIEFYKAVGARALDEAKAAEVKMKRKYAEAAACGTSAVDPVTGEQDYSAQWMEYFKTVGARALDEAKAVEAQMKRKHAEASTSAVDPVTGKPDFSAQWIEYLKSIGALDEAKAVEAQMKRKYAEAAASAKRRKY